MLPQGELEAFFLLLGGIYWSPLGMITPASPAQSRALISFILLKRIRLQQFYGLTKQDKKMPTREATQSPPPGHISPFPPQRSCARTIPDWKWAPWGSLEKAQEKIKK